MNETELRKIILCVDNSDLSTEASEATLHLAKTFNAEVVGIHGYNALMHDHAFRMIEPTLPGKYQREDLLLKQREVHNSLIREGMEKISLSYLRPIENAFHAAGVTFRARVQEGKNYQAINEQLLREGGDLVVMGSAGFHSHPKGFIGSVCLRVLRSNDRNFLVIKKPLPSQNPVCMVCLDGSSSSLGALWTARVLAGKYDGELHLVYVYDSSLHREVFGRLKESLISREGFTFRTGEQERFHDQFIDQGLARVGHRILDKAEDKAWRGPGNSENSGPSPIKKVLDGPIYKKICDYASEVKADLIFMGRTGRHFVEGMDLGSVTENVVRFSPCSVWVTKHLAPGEGDL